MLVPTGKFLLTEVDRSGRPFLVAIAPLTVRTCREMVAGIFYGELCTLLLLLYTVQGQQQTMQRNGTAPILQCVVAARSHNLREADLGWLSNSVCSNVTIYYKLESKDMFGHRPPSLQLSFPSAVLRRLPHNLGGETTVFLNYIVDNYDDLPRHLFFTQAMLKDHWEYGVGKLNLRLQDYIKRGVVYGPVTRFFVLERECWGYFIFVNRIRAAISRDEGTVFHSLNSTFFFANGMFYTTSDAIRLRSKRFYVDLLVTMVNGYNNAL